jgi:hypothetical protein
MHVAGRFSDKRTTAACLPPTALYELAAPSTPPEVQVEFYQGVSGEGATWFCCRSEMRQDTRLPRNEEKC